MFERVSGKLSEITAGFNGAQKATMAAIFVAVVAALYVFSSWASTTDMAPLYTDLETGDAATITDELTSMGVDYDLADQGRTVLVPRDQVYSLRLDLSRTGALPGGTEGYSLLDNQGITSTQFQQRVAYQRALEGEIAQMEGPDDSDVNDDDWSDEEEREREEEEEERERDEQREEEEEEERERDREEDMVDEEERERGGPVGPLAPRVGPWVPLASLYQSRAPFSDVFLPSFFGGVPWVLWGSRSSPGVPLGSPGVS